MPRIGRNISGDDAAFHLPADCRDPDRQRAYFLPRAQPGPDSRAPADERRKGVLRNPMTTQSMEPENVPSPANVPGSNFKELTKERKQSLWTGGIVGGAIRDSFMKLNPRTLMKNPVMFVVEVGSVHHDHSNWCATGIQHQRLRFRASDHAVALVHRAVRQFRGSHGRRARQSAGGHPAQSARGNGGADASGRTARSRTSPARSCARRSGEGGRRANSFPATAKLSKAWRRWTNRRSPANRLR